MNFIYSAEEAQKLYDTYNGKLIIYKLNPNTNYELDRYGWIKINLETIDQAKTMVFHYILEYLGGGVHFLNSYGDIIGVLSWEDAVLCKLSKPELLVPKFNTYGKELS